MMKNPIKMIQYIDITIPKFLWPESIRYSFVERAPLSEKESNWFWLVISFLTILSVGAWTFYYLNGLTLSYNDARSHLDVARRVVDSLQPGLAQIGSVWLPLQHIFELLTIWNDLMFRTGLSGSIVSMISFVFSGVLIWKIIKLFNLGNLAALAGVIVFSLNPNLLFLQTTPMTEALMLATSLGTIYFFIRWVRFDQIIDLILSGAISFLAVLTRYDGWFIFGFLSLLSLLITFIRFGRKRAEGNFILYSIIGFFGIAVWVGWNWIIFKDPLFFLSGPYSAKAQQDVLLSQGTLFTKGNLPLSVYSYYLAVLENTGIVLLILGTLGLGKAFFLKINLAQKLILMAFLVPVFFNILSLYLGQSAIHLPQLPPYTWFNDRYGIMTLPAVVVGIAFLISRRRVAAAIVILVVLMQSVIMYLNNDIITIQDAVRGSSGYFLDDSGNWLHNNASTGLILTAASSNDALIFKSGLPLNHFITEGAAKYWKESLIHPTKYAEYVIMHKGDLVYDKLFDNPEFLNNYQLVYQGQFVDVYKKKEGLSLTDTQN